MSKTAGAVRALDSERVGRWDEEEYLAQIRTATAAVARFRLSLGDTPAVVAVAADAAAREMHRLAAAARWYAETHPT